MVRSTKRNKPQPPPSDQRDLERNQQSPRLQSTAGNNTPRGGRTPRTLEDLLTAAEERARFEHLYTTNDIEKRIYLVSGINLAVSLGLGLGEMPIIWTLLTTFSWSDASLDGVLSLFSNAVVPSLCEFILATSTYMVVVVAYKLFLGPYGIDPRHTSESNAYLAKALHRSFLLTCISVLLRTVMLFTTPSFLLMVLITVGWAARSNSDAARMLKF